MNRRSFLKGLAATAALAVAAPELILPEKRVWALDQSMLVPQRGFICDLRPTFGPPALDPENFIMAGDFGIAPYRSLDYLYGHPQQLAVIRNFSTEPSNYPALDRALDRIERDEAQARNDLFHAIMGELAAIPGWARG